MTQLKMMTCTKIDDNSSHGYLTKVRSEWLQIVLYISSRLVHCIYHEYSYIKTDWVQHCLSFGNGGLTILRIYDIIDLGVSSRNGLVRQL